MVHDTYLTVLVLINAYFLVTALANIAYLHRSTSNARIKSGPFVSVIVPARNEERIIARCVDSLLAQDYEDYELIVVDDESEDATAEIVRARATSDPRLRLISAGPLPEGWLGKPHALSQGAIAAKGEILAFADADTFHEPSSVSWAVTNLEDHHADLLSGYLRQEYGSIGEGIIAPTLYAMMLLLPFFLLPRTKSPRIAFSVGQFVAVRRQAFDEICGFDAISDSIVDDMSMAVRMKEHGHRGVFLDARRAAGCHLYNGFTDAFDGIKRSIYSAVGGSPVAVAIVAILVLGIIVGPSVWLLWSYVFAGPPPGLLALAVGLFAVQWALVAWDRGAPLVAVVLYPIVFLNLLFILYASMVGTGFGQGVEWKGRLIRIPGHMRRSHGTQMAEK